MFEKSSTLVIFCPSTSTITCPCLIPCSKAVEFDSILVIKTPSWKNVGVTKIDIRIVSATNANLDTKIKDGEFREDLYYRLNTIPLSIPPLCERKDEIMQIAQSMMEQNCVKYGFDLKSFSKDAENELLSYSWPGNIRELISVVERAVILSETQEIQVQELYLEARK